MALTLGVLELAADTDRGSSSAPPAGRDRLVALYAYSKFPTVQLSHEVSTIPRPYFIICCCYFHVFNEQVASSVRE